MTRRAATPMRGGASNGVAVLTPAPGARAREPASSGVGDPAQLAAQLENRGAQLGSLERVRQVRAQVAELVAGIVARAYDDDAVHVGWRVDELAQRVGQ